MNKETFEALKEVIAGIGYKKPWVEEIKKIESWINEVEIKGF